jgi:hypothetical protein
MPPKAFTLGTLALALSAMPRPASAADAAVAPQEEPVLLPSLYVSTTQLLPAPESWRHAAVPGFEVLTRADDRETRRLLEELQRFNAALDVVWPGLNQSGTRPALLLLCPDRADFESFLPDGAARSAGVASLCLGGRRLDALVINVNAELNVETTDSSAQALADAGLRQHAGIRVNNTQQLYRELLYFHLSQARPRLPAWFEEGMAQVMMGIDISPKCIELGRLEDPNSIAPERLMENASDSPGAAQLMSPEDSQFQAALRNSPVMGLGTMFSLPRASQEVRNSVGGRWAKQCQAFVHLCLFGENKRHQKGFMRFLARCTERTPDEALFRECFGKSYAEMELALRHYIGSATYTSIEWNAAKGSKGLPAPVDPALRVATQAEVGRIKGEAAELAGRSDQARREFVTAFRRGERDPRLLASLGLWEQAHGEHAKAAKLLDAATRARVPGPDAYLALARLRFEDTLSAQPEPKRLPPEAFAAITPLLHAGLSQPPASADGYELLAETWARSGHRIPPDEARLLVSACISFPGRLRLLALSIPLCADAGLLKEAHILADNALRLAPSPSDRARFQALKAALPPQVH